jgi:membrane associated rhomboid family serine protease
LRRDSSPTHLTQRREAADPTDNESMAELIPPLATWRLGVRPHPFRGFRWPPPPPPYLSDAHSGHAPPFALPTRMPDPADPSPPEPPSLPPPATSEAERERPFAEREATARLLKAWSLLPGPFPGFTLLTIILAAGILALSHVWSKETFALLYATPLQLWLEWKWWGVLGSVFLHGGFLHLFFNCCWIWILGRLIERELGTVRYLVLFLVGGWIGSVAELCWSGKLGIGLSGVVYALFGFLYVNRSQHPDFQRILPRGTVQLMFGWLLVCFVLTYANVMHVANFAHLGGLVTGLVAGLAAYPRPWQRRAQLMLGSLAVISLVPLFWAPWNEQWLSARAFRAIERHDMADALRLIEKILVTDPRNVWAARAEAELKSQLHPEDKLLLKFRDEGELRYRQGDYAGARDLLTDRVARYEDIPMLNTLAWLLATCPDAAVRDGAKAVAFARRACDRDQWTHASVIDTLAAAYAESGDFASAEKWARKASENPGPDAAVIQSHLDSFRVGKPWREMPRAPGASAARP